jgi:hypothetical protein
VLDVEPLDGGVRLPDQLLDLSGPWRGLRGTQRERYENDGQSRRSR